MYNKLFTKIVDSSIWLEPTPTRLLWMMLIAVMDEDGFCQFASAANVAHRARLTVEETEQALAILEAPDANSADPDNDGRRIEKVPGGWMVLNSRKYREIVTKQMERERTRVRVAIHRKKKKQAVTGGNGEVTESNGSVTQSEAEADTEAPTKNPTPVASAPKGARFTKPTLAEVTEAMAGSPNHEREAQQFLDYYDSNGWRVGGKTPMKDWRAAVRTWKRRREDEASKPALSFKEAAKAREAELHQTPNPQYGW